MESDADPAGEVDQTTAAVATQGDGSAPTPEPEGTGTRKVRFPTALTVLAIVMLAVWIASFFVPAGIYDQNPETGAPVPGTYNELPDCGSAPPDALCSDKSLDAQFGILWRATPNGLYGIENTQTRLIGADESGFLYGSAQIFLFVLAVGAFITIAMKTGAIEAGIGRLAMRFGKKRLLLVLVLMSVFALGGTTYGMWEETLGFYALMVPLVLALGYDRVVAVGIIAVGAGTGVLASTVNPFATGVASDAAGISISDGIGLRVLMLLVLAPVGIAYVMFFAQRFGALKEAPVATAAVAGSGGGALLDDGMNGDDTRVAEAPPLTGSQKIVLTIFGLAFAIMIYGFVPWDDVWHNVFDADYPLPTFSNFYFTEASMLFIVAAVLIGVVAHMGEEGTVSTIVSGAADFLSAGLVIVLARGVTVIMRNSYITDTILYWMETAVDSLSGTWFIVLAWIVNIPIAFLVPSSSGHAALVMPILAPLSDFAGVNRALTVTAYQSASGWVNLITPTSAVIMGGLALAKVGYDKYVRFVVPYLAILFVAVTVFLMLGQAL
jgi:uncharacterized ion transporter superfamily protein YfcC